MPPPSLPDAFICFMLWPVVLRYPSHALSPVLHCVLEFNRFCFPLLFCSHSLPLSLAISLLSVLFSSNLVPCSVALMSKRCDGSRSWLSLKPSQRSYQSGFGPKYLSRGVLPRPYCFILCTGAHVFPFCLLRALFSPEAMLQR